MRAIRIQVTVTLLLPFLFSGCFFNLSEKENFKSWYYGDPGLAGALGEADCDRYADNIRGQRHPYYLHFRTPEVILQPQGGAHYPERTTAERRASRSNAAPAVCEKVERGWETIRFDAVDAGLVDMVVPYRKPSAVSDYGTVPARRNLAYAQGVVYNTGLAAIMKAPVYIVHDILKTLYIPVAGVYYMLTSESGHEASPAVEDEEEEEPAVMPDNAPDDGQEGESVDAPEPAAGRRNTAQEDVSATAPTPENEMEIQTEGSDAANWPAVYEEGSSATIENGAAPSPDAPAVGIAEEDFLKAGPSATEIVEGDADPSDDIFAEPEDEAPPSVPSVSSAPEAAAETQPPLEQVPWVRLAKGKLRKKVAFIGFFSRAVNVDTNTKAYLQERLWPVFKDQCDDDLTLVRRGDPDYPAALNALMRDRFGHLNSFELTTVSRFNGLNAIISATIIDIRVTRELGGFLWYKSPEGQLRITILAEVYDAETGTKLLDRIYIREAEVEELEPTAGEKPRGEDQPVLEKALQSIAEDMGEDVCDALDDQPWRVFVAGIDGQRITLSAGESAGLKTGNILGVYNSQIIDGLNNQQFFLTGERVGRIQIIKTSGAQSEAFLIEGQGLRDYSVAMPE